MAKLEVEDLEDLNGEIGYFLAQHKKSWRGDYRFKVDNVSYSASMDSDAFSDRRHAFAFGQEAGKINDLKVQYDPSFLKLLPYVQFLSHNEIDGRLTIYPRKGPLYLATLDIKDIFRDTRNEERLKLNQWPLISKALTPYQHVVRGISREEAVSFYTTDSEGSLWSIHLKS